MQENIERDLGRIFKKIHPGIDERVIDLTVNHSVNMAALAVRFVEKLSLGEDELGRIILLALIHDLGKVYVPADLIMAKRNFTTKEYRLVKFHPLWTGRIAGEYFPDLEREIWEAAANHHERRDGSGYPRGVGGEELSSLDLAGIVLDVLEAITNNRRSFYRLRPVPPEEIRQIFRSERFYSQEAEVVLEMFNEGVEGLIEDALRLRSALIGRALEELNASLERSGKLESQRSPRSFFRFLWPTCSPPISGMRGVPN